MGLRSFSSETSREGPITRLRPVLAAANLSPRRPVEPPVFILPLTGTRVQIYIQRTPGRFGDGAGGSQTDVEPSAHAVRDQPCDLNGHQGHRKGPPAHVAQPCIPPQPANRGGSGEGEVARSNYACERRRERRGLGKKVHGRAQDRPRQGQRRRRGRRTRTKERRTLRTWRNKSSPRRPPRLSARTRRRPKHARETKPWRKFY